MLHMNGQCFCVRVGEGGGVLYHLAFCSLRFLVDCDDNNYVYYKREYRKQQLNENLLCI